ncbi:hypothetical protein BDW74DRAFT_123756 [Aspergillus multicolor]|uniref:uncharacterized protein n=1 Tax=Aspergillus multicolor TaxID=41759 RepID=UPI003CCE23C4
MSQQVYIDHLLLQFSQEQFDPLPSWISDNFTVIEGGVHTGGLSRNKLIVFKDGTYLELYNWITKPDDWRERLPGDFALTALAPISAEASRERIVKALESEPRDGKLGVTYLPPRDGGRKNPEGVDIRWKIVKAQYTQAESTPPDEFYPRGRTDAPFFCYDLTLRKHRVTFDQSSVTQHPSGTTGIDRIEVLVPKDKFRAYTDLYASVVGASPQQTEAGVEFRLSAPGIQSFSGSLLIRPAETEADEQFLREKGVGISSLVLRSETGAPFSFAIVDYLQ